MKSPSSMISILADKYLYKIEKFLPEEANLTLFDSNEPLQTILGDTDALLIRTVTKINPHTFSELPKRLSFIGTGSSGIDHIDTAYLRENNIGFANAAGCNARSVGEYIATALLLWSEARHINLKKLKVGIIGAGHTGSEALNILQHLDVSTFCYDPPRELREEDFSSASLEEALNCDILTFHTPLTTEAPYPTFHWLDEEKLSANKFSLVINASRGGVVDEQALMASFDAGKVKDFVLDVWENEPHFSDDAARRAFITTPHIAGYSIQAKERASKMIADALCEHFSVERKKVTPSQRAETSPGQQPPAKFWSLTDALTYFHPMEDYKTRFMMLIGRSDKEKTKGFNHIRSTHPLRNEFQFLSISDYVKKQFPALKTLFVTN